MTLYSSKIKKFLIFFQKKAFLIFPKTETSKEFLIFQEMELSYISGSNFPRSKSLKEITLKKLFIFQEMQLGSPKLRKLVIFQEKTRKG